MEQIFTIVNVILIFPDTVFKILEKQYLTDYGINYTNIHLSNAHIINNNLPT